MSDATRRKKNPLPTADRGRSSSTVPHLPPKPSTKCKAAAQKGRARSERREVKKIKRKRGCQRRRRQAVWHKRACYCSCKKRCEGLPRPDCRAAFFLFPTPRNSHAARRRTGPGGEKGSSKFAGPLPKKRRGGTRRQRNVDVTAGVNKTRKHAPLERKRAGEKREAERDGERVGSTPGVFREKSCRLP